MNSNAKSNPIHNPDLKRDTVSPPAEGRKLERILRVPDVLKLAGIGRTSLWQMVKRGQFPGPVHLTTKAIGFVESEVHGWISDRIEARNSATRRQS